jgi:hypothetical protein
LLLWQAIKREIVPWLGVLDEIAAQRKRGWESSS